MANLNEIADDIKRLSPPDRLRLAADMFEACEVMRKTDPERCVGTYRLALAIDRVSSR